MEEANYIVLVEGIETRLVFDSYAWATITITDPDLHKEKRVKSLKFHVVRIDDEPVSTIFSILAKGLIGEMEPYLKDNKYLSYEFTFVKTWARGVGAKLVSTKKIVRF